MTELEKKQSGQIYDARNPELRKQQDHAKDLQMEHTDGAEE